MTSAETLTKERPRKRWLLTIGIVVAVAIAVAAYGAGQRDANPTAQPTPLVRHVVEPLRLAGNHGVSTDRDNRRFTYALTVVNSADSPVAVVALQLRPTTGTRVVLSSVLSPEEFTEVWNPAYVPVDRPNRMRIAAGAEAVLMMRVQVDCTQPPALTHMLVSLSAASGEIEQEIVAATANSSGAPELRALPRRTCS